MRKTIILGGGIVLLLAGYFGYRVFGQVQATRAAQTDFQTAALERGTPVAQVGASGTVHSNQSALLTWETSGTVGEVKVAAGERVSEGEDLAALAPSSLPPRTILAQAELVEARRTLDDLINSKLQRAQALQAVEDARKTLDDLLNPEMAQAEALEAVAEAQKAVEDAELQAYILTTPPSQAAMDQAHANLLLRENKLHNTREQLERMQRQLKAVPPGFRGGLKKGIENLELRLIQDQISHDQAAEKYEDMLDPASPTDLAVAQANLETAQARLAQAQRDYDGLKEGLTQGEIAVAEARLADAQREWERLENGPDPDDIAAAQARVEAAQATLDQVRIAAPFDGVITQVFNQPGDQVEAGTPAFRLDDLSRRLVDLQVSEIDIPEIKAGQSAILTFDGIPGQAYHGQVAEVAPVGTETEGAVYFPVIIEITDADQAVRPGMTAEAEILVSP